VWHLPSMSGHKSSIMLSRYKRAAGTPAEAELGGLVPLHEAIPELAGGES
jgi:hypothetical protein